MKTNKVSFIIGMVVIIVIALIAVLLAFSNVKEFEGIIIVKEEDRVYDNVLITSFNEYQDFLKEYNALGRLTESDFIKYDYLVDYIPYIKDMTIRDIKIKVEHNGLHVIYDIDKEVSETDKLLASIIPIKKSTVTDIGTVTRSFK